MEPDENENERERKNDHTPAQLKELATHLHKHSGHPGQKVTERLVREQYSRSGIRETVKQVLRECDVCMRLNSEGAGVYPTQHDYMGLPVPLHTISIDIVGPWPLSTHKNRYLITICDIGSRYLQAYPVKRIRSVDVLSAIEAFASTYGTPQHIITDNGSQFVSEAIKQVYKQWGIKHRAVSAYRPQANGIIERKHRQLKQIQRKLMRQGGMAIVEWDKVVQEAVRIMNGIPSDGLGGVSPNELLFGRRLRPLPVTTCSHNEQPTADQHITMALEERARAHGIAKQVLEARGKQRRERDGRKQRAAPTVGLRAGQPVYVRVEDTSQFVPGVVTEDQIGSSCMVEVNGHLSRRHVSDIKVVGKDQELRGQEE
jgi:transposase InsO family protein